MLQNVRAKGNLDKYEMRGSRYGAFDLFKKQTDEPTSIITQKMKDEFWGSIGRTFQVPVVDYDGNVTISSGVARSITVADSENTTQLVTITPTTLSFGFTMVPTLYHNNEIDYSLDFYKKMTKYLNALGATLDTMCITALNTNRTLVCGNNLGYTFAAGTEVLTGTAADRGHMVGSLEAVMASNDFYGKLHVVGETGLQDLINVLKQSGIYNAVNKQLEYNGMELHFTNRIQATPSYCKGYAVNEGSVGLLFRVDREALAHTVSRTGYEWDTTVLPMLDIPCGTMYYESDGNYSAIAGAASADMTASHKQHFGFSVDVAVVCAYNSASATNASPILAFECA